VGQEAVDALDDGCELDDGTQDWVPTLRVCPFVVFAPVFLVLESDRHVARLGERRVIVWDYLV